LVIMLINRLIIKDLKAEIAQPQILILLGARQVGKTTLLHQLEEYAKKTGLKTCFFDLEQPQTLADFNRSDKEIIELISQSGDVVFIDEFQYLKNASKIFKAIYDSNVRVKIVCSGSSSIEIHKHLKESLAGRRFVYKIYPLSYSEIKTAAVYSFEDYLTFGGMPALTQIESAKRRQIILNELLGSYILKDIKSLLKEENIRAFNHLLYLLAEKQGSLMVSHSLAKEVGLSIKTINRYLDILEETYVNFRIYSYSNNLGNELKKSCKTYLYDLGIRNALLKDFSSVNDRPDKGTILETFVFLHIQSKIEPNMEIRFWRTKDGSEVDFILVKDRKPIPIEVKSVISAGQIPDGLKKFLTRYPNTKKAFVINQNIQTETIFNNCKIQFLQFEDFESNFQI
jgi:predicted AAA+ superfamily ATPase